MNRNTKREPTYLSGSLYESLWMNTHNLKGVTYHFLYENWAKTDGFWTIYRFVDNQLDEDGLDYYGLSKGLEKYKREGDCKNIFIYKYSRKKRKFITRKIL